ncbi:hypothetical protein ACFWFC_12290, partial [Streptomyces venezuelae]
QQSGPGAPQPGAAQPGYGYPQSGPGADQPGYGAQQSGPGAPQPGAAQPGYGYPQSGPGADQPGYSAQQSGPGVPQPNTPEPGYGYPHSGPSAPQGQPGPYGQGQTGGAPYGAHAAPQGQGAHGAQSAHGAHAAPRPEQPQPPSPQPRHGAHAAPQGAHAALPPAGQSAPLPPVAAPGAGSDSDATQYIPPVAADEGVTQYIPPVGPGALPPEAPAADATQFLGRANGPAAGSDSDPTQFIAPVPAGPVNPAGPTAPPEPAGAPYGIRPGAPGDRQPPAEFDSLFRTEPEAEGPASTQQMPRVQAQGPAPVPAPEPAGGGRGGGGRRTRTGSKVPLIAAVGVGIAVLGIGAGALLSAGGDEDDAKDDGRPVSASGEPDERPSPSADPAKDQAVALDKLLADSNNSRDSVIAAVRNVGKCQNLGQSAKDLRAAAKQRDGLVTRLAGLKVDKLPANDQLTASLNKAWKASAAADNHYAAWADQVGGKKGCKKGHARGTPQAAAGNRESGTATTAKEQAANHWNAIARKYSLTERNKTQL